MTYNKTNYVDGSTPLNASNFNNNESALEQAVQDITSLSNAITQVDNKVSSHTHTELHSHANKSVLDGINSTKVNEWNSKSTFDGNYNNLTNKPTIPTVDVNKSYVDAQDVNIQNQINNLVTEYTDEVIEIEFPGIQNEVNELISQYADISSEVESLKLSVSNGKILIATAITDMGVSANGSDTFEQLANKIRQINGNPTIPTSTIVIKMSNNLIKSNIGEVKNLIPTLSILDYDDVEFVWSSTNESIATVNQEGLIETKALGSCKIKAKHVSTNIEVECNIDVIDEESTDPPKQVVDLGAWVTGGLDYLGADETKTFTVKSSNYVPISGSYPIEFTLPTGIVWSKVHFYDNNKLCVSNENEGLFCGNDVPIAGTLKQFKPPINTKYMRIQICGADYQLSTSQFRANELIGKEIIVEPEVSYDRYESNGVILNTRHRIMKPSSTYQLNATETPREATNGLTYSSTNTSIATVSQSGLITSVGVGNCNIEVKNNKGETESVEIIVKNTINTGSNLTNIKSAIETGVETTGNGQSFNVTSQDIGVPTNNPVIRNSTFVGTNKTVLALNTGSKNITFEDCTFDNVSFFLSSVAGTLKFINCEFKNWQTTPIFVNSNNAKIECEYTTFKDAKPNVQEWINNEGWIRFHGYNPIEVTANNVSVKVNKSTFNNVMSRCLIHWQHGYSGGYIQLNDSTIHTTEGHGLNMESECSGETLRNHFSYLGELRGAFGEESLSGEDTYYPGCLGVGGNAIYSHVESANYCDVVANYNKIRYAMENGIEGGLKEIAYNYIEYMGYRYLDGYNNFSMEGIWGSARNGIHHNTIINPNMDGIRIQYNGISNNVPCNVNNNIMIFNNNVESKVLNNCGVSVVSSEGSNEGVIVHDNTIIGFKEITKVDVGIPPYNYDLQTESEYAYIVNTQPPIPVTDVALNKSSYTFNNTDSLQLVATVIPEDANNKLITWTTDNIYVATVSPSGLVRPVGNGTCAIEVRTADGNFKNTCNITVNIEEVEIEPVNYFDINNTEVSSQYSSTYVVDKVNKKVDVTSTNVGGLDGYVKWSLPTLQEGRTYKLTCTTNDTRNFIRIRVNGNVSVSQDQLTSYDYTFTGKDGSTNLIDLEMGIRHRNDSSTTPINIEFMDVKIVDVNGDPDIPTVENGLTFTVEDYKIIITDGTDTEIYDACCDIPTGDYVKGYKTVIKNRVAYHLPLSNSGSSVFSINGLKPINHGYIDATFKAKFSNRAYGIAQNTLTFPLRNDPIKPVNEEALMEAIRIFNCAIPGKMKIVIDENSQNTVSEDYFVEEFFGVCRLYQGEKFRVDMNTRFFGNQAKDNSFIKVLVHEFGHITGIWDDSPHFPSMYNYDRDWSKTLYLQPSDIMHIKDKYSHLLT